MAAVSTPVVAIRGGRWGGGVAGSGAVDGHGDGVSAGPVVVGTPGSSGRRARAGRRRRPNGDGTITRRRDGLWQGAVFVTTSHGVRRREYVYGRDRDLVRDRVAALVAREAAGRPVPHERWTLGAYLDSWLAEVVRPTRAPRTYQGYEAVVRRYLVPVIGHRPLARLSTRDVHRVLGQVRAGGGVAAAGAVGACGAADRVDGPHRSRRRRPAGLLPLSPQVQMVLGQAAQQLPAGCRRRSSRSVCVHPVAAGSPSIDTSDSNSSRDRSNPSPPAPSWPYPDMRAPSSRSGLRHLERRQKEPSHHAATPQTRSSTTP